MKSVPEFLSSLLTKPKIWFLTKRDSWIKRKIPSKNEIQLNINNTFILPSRFGLSCIGIAICLFVLGTNFQNNIILLLCYFIIAILLLSIFHSYFFFIQHKIEFKEISPDFENRRLSIPICIESTLRYQGGNLIFSINNHSQTIAVGTSKTYTKLKLAEMKRGSYLCPEVSLSAAYGFGLFKCYSQLTPNLSILVYPAMQISPLALRDAQSNQPISSGGQFQQFRTDDLQGIREYVNTDSLKHVSWKHAAKGQGLLTKSFVDNKGMTGWIFLDDFLHLEIEQALRCICYQVLQLDKEQVVFGLDLGSQKVIPSYGDEHVKSCLTQLALYPSQKSSESSSVSQITNARAIHAD